MLWTDKEPGEMYTIDVHTEIYHPERGVLGQHLVIKKIKNSDRVDEDDIETGTWIFNNVEQAQEEMHNPECSICGTEFGEDDKIYYGKARDFSQFPEKELHCEDCKRKRRIAQEL